MKKLLIAFSLFALVGCAGLDMAQIQQYWEIWETYQGMLIPPRPTPTPIPQPVPQPVPVPEPPITPPITESFVVFDLDLMPDAMRAFGLGPASDNACYYGLSFVARSGPGGQMPDDLAGSMIALNSQRDRIQAFLDSQIQKARDILKSSPNALATVISSDGPERLGCRLGPPVFDVLHSEFPGRVSMGVIFPQEGC